MEFDTFNVQQHFQRYSHSVSLFFRLWFSLLCITHYTSCVYSVLNFSACVYLVRAYRYPICVFNAQQANNLRTKNEKQIETVNMGKEHTTTGHQNCSFFAFCSQLKWMLYWKRVTLWFFCWFEYEKGFLCVISWNLNDLLATNVLRSRQKKANQLTALRELTT